jgi:hypothetical protein
MSRCPTCITTVRPRSIACRSSASCSGATHPFGLVYLPMRRCLVLPLPTTGLWPLSLVILSPHPRQPSILNSMLPPSPSLHAQPSPRPEQAGPTHSGRATGRRTEFRFTQMPCQRSRHRSWNRVSIHTGAISAACFLDPLNF